MKNMKYTSIKGPKRTMTDYLKSLSNEDLQSIYKSSFFYGLQIPGLVKKMHTEMEKRRVYTQLTMF